MELHGWIRSTYWVRRNWRRFETCSDLPLTSFAAISGSASLSAVAPLALNNFNLFNPVSGTTTGTWSFDEGSQPACFSGAAQCTPIWTNQSRMVNNYLAGTNTQTSFGLSHDQYSRSFLGFDASNPYTFQMRGYGTPDGTGYFTAKLVPLQMTSANGCTGSYSSGWQLFTENKSTANSTDTSTPTAVFDCLGSFGVGSISYASGNGFYVDKNGNTTAHNLTLTGSCSGCALSATTSSIGGSVLALNACSTTTVSVPGATTAMAVFVSPVVDPNSAGSRLYDWYGYVSSANTVTVKVCALAAGTPTTSTYNVRVIQ